ncbi:MAG: PIN domain-containing protein [Deltaproteobacteria bacterium]|nr:PIN domain-containing protein [Deltaproteobacteria bacterium]MBW1930494.1 PIN domain-containing protein [Deltaproteobacteria bacterium]MBW2025451.1 PIN domain-containing protein [Deltaproteobacteria bacterium]MBW2126105.1 PIN domain-containing protein [Deltaproteobacteria bacterium]RLB14384.1 MAG: pilus assembly protein [Deltaproteobacteria bacterium]
MRRDVILDTGPLVAFLNRRDRYHQWVVEQWAGIEPPLLTCEPVLSEACFLLSRIQGGQEAVFELLRRKVLDVSFKLNQHLERLSFLINKYCELPISLADACLIRMAELYPESSVFTLDKDFKIYKKDRAKVIPILYPHRRKR